jgi:AGCS family alanine or glycine:cation symporter
MALQEKLGIDERINEAFQPISNFWEALILHEFFGTGIPTIIFLLVGGAAFFTLYFGFINVRGFGLSLRTVMGRYDGLDEKRKGSGEVSHFQALATAVSGTVGNGNIAGVAMAIAIGGPGATFWMILCGLLGMSSKFVECTLGVKYRDVGEDGTVYGGPMYYLSKGLKERGFEKFGKVLAVIFAVLCIGASFGGGNAAQSNQAALQMVDLFGLTGGSARTIVGIIMMVVVGIIIIGGIKRIASVTEKIVPFMAGMYVLACLYIIFSNLSFVDDAFAMIINGAFAPTAAVGGFIGVLIQGFRRGAFSNEAGAGSASIAHSAVITSYPASEGLVALLEPFIDTVVICTMTALVIIIFN